MANNKGSDKAKNANGKEKNLANSCECGAPMESKDIHVPGSKGFTLPAQVCTKCGRHRFIKTEAFMMTRLAAAEPVRKKLQKIGANYMIVIPKKIENAMNLNDETEVEITVEGFSKLGLHFVHHEREN